MVEISFAFVAIIVALNIFIHQFGVTFEKQINWKIYLISNIGVVVTILLMSVNLTKEMVI